MKNIFFIIIGIIIISCKSDPKKNESITIDTKEEVKEIKSYPKIEDNMDGLETIFDNEFTFFDGLTVDEIGVEKIDEHVYRIVYFLNDDCDFEKIEKLNVAFRIYPENPSLFRNEANKKAKARTLATKSNIMDLDGVKVIVSDNLEVYPKKLKKIKIFFYDPKIGVQGETMTILDVNFS
ncbi:hypothetical protein MHTCC0001_22950 [Flavobacteriaceae bacterium MHTCC 0001]